MKNQKKFKALFKRLISGVSAIALSVGLLGIIPASADDSNAGYKYTLFAYGSEDGAISSSAANFCVNGNIATNGTISAGQNFNVNGEKKEHANEVMPDLTKAINEKFFAENVDVKTENYSKNETNIEVKFPTDVKGKAELNGNIQLSAGLKAMGDIALSGNVLNKNSTVLFSENGNIVINTENANLTGLIYAPKGNIVIDSKNLNLNSILMIANKITLNAPNININNSASMAKFVQESIDKNGNSSSGDENEEDPEPVTDPAIYAYGEYNEEIKSVDIEWYSNVTGEFAVLESLNGTDYTVVSKVSDDTKYSIKVASDFIKKFYKVTTIKDGKTIESIPFSIVNANGKYSTELLDTDKDGLADLYEEMLGTDKTLPDTDKDGLTDYEEAYITNTNPTKYDSVTEGVSDANADNDKDGLTNKRELELKTDPNSDDTDGDTLKDGDEVNKYNTDPLKKDTDGDDLEDDDEFKFNCDPNKKDTDNNGIIDGKEKHKQTVDVVPDNKEQAVTKVSVSMNATSNIEKTTTVESIMDKDVLCSNVVGLVGEPFSIESESSFEKATITFTVDKTKLRETEFDNLMFLWYDREDDNFVELETSHDSVNSTVSVETIHFSYYLIVDSKQWWDNWKQIEDGINDLSHSNNYRIPIDTTFVSCCSDSSDPYFYVPDEYSTTVQHYTNYRTLVCEHLISSLSESEYECYDGLKHGDGLRFAYLEKPGVFGGTAWIYGLKNGYFDLVSRYYGNNSEREILEKEWKEKGSYVSVDDKSLWFVNHDLRRRLIYFVDHDITKEFSNDTICGYIILAGDAGIIRHGYDKTIPVYFVCIGDFDKTNLEKIASETGGKVYDAATLNDFYTDPRFMLVDVNPKDTDGDGFTDAEETYGLVVDSSGTRYKTDPKEKDTDKDGLKDNEEVEVNRVSVETTDDKGNKVIKSYHHMNSDPTKKDTDDDGYFDKNDPRPNESDVTITKLKNDYIRIVKNGDNQDISFGGDQGWFADGTKKGEFISDYGCGLIAASDLILYLSRKDKKYSTPLTELVPKTDYISLEDYKKFVLAFDVLYVRLKWLINIGSVKLNTLDGNLGIILSNYFSDNDIDLEANWGYEENSFMNKITVLEESLRARRIKGMITNDIPAVISVGPYFSGSIIGVRKYTINDSDSTKGNGNMYRESGDPITGHYFTVTGIIEDRIKHERGDINSIMYEISSWGGKYYISELELKFYSYERVSTIVTNVLCLEETQ